MLAGHHGSPLFSQDRKTVLVRLKSRIDGGCVLKGNLCLSACSSMAFKVVRRCAATLFAAANS